MALSGIHVSSIYENRKLMLEQFEHIRDSEAIDSNTYIQQQGVQQATGFVRILNDNQFIFWLKFYHRIRPHVTIFFDPIQKREIDAAVVENSVQRFAFAVSIVCKIYEDNLIDSESSSRCVENINKKNNRFAALKVCDTINNIIEDRFKFSSHLSGS